MDPQNKASHFKSLVVFADDWGRHPSSCQHLIRRLQSDHKILWVNTIGTRSPKANAFTIFRGVEKIKSWFRGIRQVSDSMWVIDAPMLPFIGNWLARKVNQMIVSFVIKRAMRVAGIVSPTLITTLPHVAWLIGDLGQKHTVYYCTDDYSQWPEAERDALMEAERDLQARADLALAVSDRLVERNRAVAKSVHFPHAVDYDHFSTVRQTDVHTEIAGLPAPRIGFFGLIYEKLDFELLEQVAQHFSDGSLIMIGPIDYRPEAISQLSNVHFVGRKSYETLPAWLAGLDVLLMPYVKDEMIRQSSPLKLKECLATGLPTLCVDLPEARKAEPYVRVAKDNAEFIVILSEVLRDKQLSTTPEERQAFVHNDTWDARAKELRRILDELT
jgi:glycosyltransferase involved in cell wall biosynthesis